MKPRKRVMVVDSRSERLSRRVFLLQTNHYEVLRRQSAKETLQLLASEPPCRPIDCVLVELDLSPESQDPMDGNDLVKRLKEICPGLPALIVSETSWSYDRATAADVFLPKGGCSPAEILERLRVLCARKRGPKKKPVQNAAAEVRRESLVG